MAAPFHLLVVTPGRTIYDGKVESAVFPAAEGMMGVLPGHAPFFGLLKAGTVSAHTVSSTPAPSPSPLSIRVSGGTVQILPDEVIVLAEGVEDLKHDD